MGGILLSGMSGESWWGRGYDRWGWERVTYVQLLHGMDSSVRLQRRTQNAKIKILVLFFLQKCMNPFHARFGHLWFSFQWRFQRHIVWSSLLHSSSRCPIWVVVTVYIHRILCTYLLFVIKVIFPIDLFFPFFCWFCFNYSSFIHIKWICVLVSLLLSFVDFGLVIVTTIFKFIR